MIREYLPRIREHLPLAIVTIITGGFLIWILMEAPPFGIGHGLGKSVPGFEGWDCANVPNVDVCIKRLPEQPATP